MGHNTSRQKAAGYVREQLLAGYSDWNLIADCDRCSLTLTEHQARRVCEWTELDPDELVHR